MAHPVDRFVLPDVPPINGAEHPDTFLETLSIAASHGAGDLAPRFPMGVYPHLSGFTGRGWLIGFDDACWYWEAHGARRPEPDFPVTGIDANLRHHQTLSEAVAYLGHVPQLLWNGESRYALEHGRPAVLAGSTETVDGAEVRRYVVDYLTRVGRPVVCFLHAPDPTTVEAAVLTGYEAGGATILGRSPHYPAPAQDPPQQGYFRLPAWEREVVLIAGLAGEAPPAATPHPCYAAIENALERSESRTEGTRHYGRAAYDAWEAALLDDPGTTAGDDRAVSRRLLYHSMVAGTIACQKAFTALRDYWNDVPSMGVVSGLLQRAAAGPQIIHGLMWDVWHVAGGYWRGIEDGDPEFGRRWTNLEDVARYRERSVRERAAAVVRRARRTDEEALAELRQAKADWDRCRGQGSRHPCPCRDAGCTRV